MELNISLVATRRPELLATTLESFHDKIFGHVSIGKVRANLDPIFGSENDHANCIALIRRYFGNATIREPRTPGFGAAIKWLWRDVPDGIFLHMEDDWICLEQVDLRCISSLMRESTTCVSLLSETHGKKGLSSFSTVNYKKRFLGIRYANITASAFNTSPGFLLGQFARECAQRMNPELDPEKQMRRPHNDKLTGFVEGYCCAFHKSSDGGPVIKDIGRQWMAGRGIAKVTSDGRSNWIRDRPDHQG